MLVTDLAFRDMEATSRGVANRLARLIRRVFRVESAPLAPGPVLTVVRDPMSSSACSVAIEHDALVPAEHRFRWRRHPQLLGPAGQERSLDPADDLARSARSAAIRGLFLARGNRLEEARAAFEAAAADPAIDLTALPGFWDLSRGGMMAAAGAYEDVARYRDAAGLAARVRLKYRPRSISSPPVVPARRSAT